MNELDYNAAECERTGHADAGDGVCWCGLVVYYESPDEEQSTD